MDITLSGMLEVVGSLDDSPGEGSAREVFRRFLRQYVRDVGQLRDYVNECLRTSGTQYNRALQDLVNYVGSFLGFKVKYGRYQGVPGKTGCDGCWTSSIEPDRFHIVVESKTTEAYAIKTATLVGYVDDLISKKKIPSWDNALGLYVIGRPDPELKQLENAIIAEKRSNQLRIISADSLLSLAEMMNEYDVSHEDILAVLRPSGPTIDPIVDLMARLVAQQITEKRSTESIPVATPTESIPETTGTAISLAEDAPSYWLTPVKSDEEETAEETITTLVGQEHIYAFGERTPGRRHIKPGDWICFYSTRKGVVAHARVTSLPRKELNPKVRHAEQYPWVFDLDSEELYLNEPVIIDASLRTDLDAFKDKDINKNWAWYVQANNKITKHDFNILTRQQSSS